MRKTILFLFLMCNIFSFAQVNMEKVLIEMGTATWNNACSNEVSILNELKNQGLDIAIVNYHLNDPFANQFSNVRASYYNIQSVPYPVVQGIHIENGNIQNYLDVYESAINQNSSFVISAEGGFSGDTLLLETSVQKIANYESDVLKLHIALIESNIAYEWLQQDELDEVERKMAPDANGSNLDFSDSDTQTFNLEIILEENWNPAEMELIAFVQNDTSKEVLQCHSVAFTEFSPLPVHAFFQTEDSIICRKDFATFENFSTGDVESFEWYFEGGTPESTTEEYPTVKYDETGEFDVRLIVNNSISLDTTLKEDYILVRELPAIDFSPLPEFCHDDPPYELVEGWPAEGQYFGLFVDTGYFHPETAGQGIYTIYFAYQNEETLCSDTLSQDAIVQLCNSVNELNESHMIKWHWIHNQLLLNLNKNLSGPQTEILIYNTTGQLLARKKIVNDNEIMIDIPPPIQHLILVVNTNKKTETYKVCK